LVVLIRPPGGVVRLLQRVGRSGHGPGRARHGLVLTSGAADFLEAVVTGKAGLSGQCEPLHPAAGPVEVPCPHPPGMAAPRAWSAPEALALIRRAHSYRHLRDADFEDCLRYLSGQLSRGQESLEGNGSGSPWLPPRLRWDGDTFVIRNACTARVIRR